MKEYIFSRPDEAEDTVKRDANYRGELIRCKDCTHSNPIDSEWLECKHDKRVMKENGFCSWAEPKVKK